MARKPFNTTLDEETQKKFKETCSEVGLVMNTTLEILMNGFVNGDIKLTYEKGKFSIDTNSKD